MAFLKFHCKSICIRNLTVEMAKHPYTLQCIRKLGGYFHCFTPSFWSRFLLRTPWQKTCHRWSLLLFAMSYYRIIFSWKPGAFEFYNHCTDNGVETWGNQVSIWVGIWLLSKMNPPQTSPKEKAISICRGEGMLIRN